MQIRDTRVLVLILNVLRFYKYITSTVHLSTFSTHAVKINLFVVTKLNLTEVFKSSNFFLFCYF